MTRFRPHSLGAGLAVCTVLAALLGVWPVARPSVSAESPVVTPLPLEMASATSPPTPAAGARTESGVHIGQVLLWTAVGLVLGLGVILATHAWYQRSSR
jgi:hypothetical protein